MALSLLILFVFIAAAVLAPLFVPYDPNSQEFAERLAPPGEKHLLGTDSYGRDVLSRIIYGARVSLMVAFFATGFAVVAGTLLGVSAAYLGGNFDRLLVNCRLADGVSGGAVRALAGGGWDQVCRILL